MQTTQATRISADRGRVTARGIGRNSFIGKALP
jgi:hypothetical protein